MELNFKLIVLTLSILFTGLTAGLCFTWANAVTPGLGRLDDLGFLKAFQAMNRTILNPTFIIVFMGPCLLLFINAFIFKNINQFAFTSYLVAAVLFFAGVGLITIFKNVPLNEILDKTVLETATNVELSELRKTFEQPWNQWHMVRTVCSFTSFALLVTGLLFNK
ncbi:anthrone oxygenase family protein [Winogradskyella aquimaris]|uniref:Anthrone oxygenase family protein n=1 Tax=Winogradskyella aquimaris TaxID=864074 RepID=A0ABU5EK95_9FLAO|nr:anthrone oxygenase family protein [Winogradskyella aquimaris]MDY2586810.1 anthrone oxygenase family protein [Winogradskyella aquimaris]